MEKLPVWIRPNLIYLTSNPKYIQRVSALNDLLKLIKFYHLKAYFQLVDESDGCGCNLPRFENRFDITISNEFG